MNLPTISIIIPTYNSEKVLRACLESIKKQDYPREKGARAIAGHVRKSGRITNKEYRQINRSTKKTATRDLQELVTTGILERKGRTGRGVYYVLNPAYKGT